MAVRKVSQYLKQCKGDTSFCLEKYIVIKSKQHSETSLYKPQTGLFRRVKSVFRLLTNPKTFQFSFLFKAKAGFSDP